MSEDNLSNLVDWWRYHFVSGFTKVVSHMWQFLIESLKRFVYRPSSHTLYALVYLHSSKWIRLVSLCAGWLSYSQFSALALKSIHSGNTSYPLPANRFFFSVLQKLIPSRKLECLKRHDHLKDIRISLAWYLQNFVLVSSFNPKWLNTYRRLDGRTESWWRKACWVTDKWFRHELSIELLKAISE